MLYATTPFSMISDPHSIPGKHVTKWVKITSSTVQRISISFKPDY